MTYSIIWEDVAADQIATLTKSYPEAPMLIGEAAYELLENPRPSNSVTLGSPASPVRRLLLGFYRVTYVVQDDLATVTILSVGRSDTPR